MRGKAEGGGGGFERVARLKIGRPQCIPHDRDEAVDFRFEPMARTTASTGGNEQCLTADPIISARRANAGPFSSIISRFMT